MKVHIEWFNKILIPALQKNSLPTTLSVVSIEESILYLNAINAINSSKYVFDNGTKEINQLLSVIQKRCSKTICNHIAIYGQKEISKGGYSVINIGPSMLISEEHVSTFHWMYWVYLEFRSKIAEVMWEVIKIYKS